MVCVCLFHINFRKLGRKENKDVYVIEILHNQQSLKYLLLSHLHRKVPSTWMRT